MKYWISFCFVIIIATLLSLWQWVINSPVLSYGDAAKTYFVPSLASPGQKIEICFDDITWYKLCPSELITYFQPSKGHRKDFPTYTIGVPISVGKVAPKCRQFVVPDVEQDGYGIGEWYGHANHKCMINIHTELPKVKLEIIKK